MNYGGRPETAGEYCIFTAGVNIPAVPNLYLLLVIDEAQQSFGQSN